MASIKAWFEENPSIGTVVKIAGYLVAATVFITMLRSDIDSIQEERERHVESANHQFEVVIPSTYMRKDVMEIILGRLDRIEDKIDQHNENN